MDEEDKVFACRPPKSRLTLISNFRRLDAIGLAAMADEATARGRVGKMGTEKGSGEGKAQVFYRLKLAGPAMGGLLVLV